MYCVTCHFFVINGEKCSVYGHLVYRWTNTTKYKAEGKSGDKDLFMWDDWCLIEHHWECRWCPPVADGEILQQEK